MAQLFGRDKSVIGKHVRAIFKDGELQKDSVWAKFAYTASDGKTYQVDYYNLDVIISVGYRVKSVQGTQFRVWATGVLRKYLLQGYSISRHLVDFYPSCRDGVLRGRLLYGTCCLGKSGEVDLAQGGNH